jgi:hypothetical protein
VKRHLAENIYDYLPWIFKYSTDRKIRIFASLLFNWSSVFNVQCIYVSSALNSWHIGTIVHHLKYLPCPCHFKSVTPVYVSSAWKWGHIGTIFHRLKHLPCPCHSKSVTPVYVSSAWKWGHIGTIVHHLKYLPCPCHSKSVTPLATLGGVE